MTVKVKLNFFSPPTIPQTLQTYSIQSSSYFIPNFCSLTISDGHLKSAYLSLQTAASLTDPYTIRAECRSQTQQPHPVKKIQNIFMLKAGLVFTGTSTGFRNLWVSGTVSLLKAVLCIICCCQECYQDGKQIQSRLKATWGKIPENQCCWTNEYFIVLEEGKEESRNAV